MSILLPKDNGGVILTETLPTPPINYRWIQIDCTEWVLQDSCNRLCVDIMLRKAYALRPPTEIDMAWDQWYRRNQPGDWLRNKFPTAYRAHLMDRLGHDPVHVNSGGKRGNYQSANSRIGNITSGFWQLRVSANGNVQTYGTYMDPRMFVDFSGSINIPFHDYVNEIYMQYANNPLSGSGLVMPTDSLHEENNAINNRHAEVIRAVDAVSPNLKAPYVSAVWAIDDYNLWLRSDYNINTSTVGILEWLKYNGLFYISYLNTSDVRYDMYQPKPEYVNKLTGLGLFDVNYKMVNNIMVPTVIITINGHNSLIDAIVKHFGNII